MVGGDTAHVEVCRHYPKAVEYCKKEESRVGGPWEYGKMTSQGARTDLHAAVAMVVGGKRPREIAMEEPLLYARFHKNLQALRAELEIPTQRDGLAVVLLWGKTRTGKTRAVYDSWNANDVYRVFDQEKSWFDGYQGEKIALFDDYGEGMMNIHRMKTVLDRYPLRLPIKGSSVSWNPELVIITSNGTPETWYPTARSEDLEALSARMTIFKFPDQSADALKWLADNNPLRPRPVMQRGRTPPRERPPNPISVNSESSSDDLTDLVAPSWEQEILEEL
jgi:hypothetical protein